MSRLLNSASKIAVFRSHIISVELDISLKKPLNSTPCVNYNQNHFRCMSISSDKIALGGPDGAISVHDYNGRLQVSNTLLRRNFN